MIGCVFAVDDASFSVGDEVRRGRSFDLSATFTCETTTDAHAFDALRAMLPPPKPAHAIINGYDIGTVSPEPGDAPGTIGVDIWPWVARAVEAVERGWLVAPDGAVRAWARLSPGKRARINRRLRGAR